MKKTETMWAIASLDYGLYTGTWRTRSQAIDGYLLRALYGSIYGRDEFRRLRWLECRRRGDRAVKVTISYEVA